MWGKNPEKYFPLNHGRKGCTTCNRHNAPNRRNISILEQTERCHRLEIKVILRFRDTPCNFYVGKKSRKILLSNIWSEVRCATIRWRNAQKSAEYLDFGADREVLLTRN